MNLTSFFHTVASAMRDSSSISDAFDQNMSMINNFRILESKKDSLDAYRAFGGDDLEDFIV